MELLSVVKLLAEYEQELLGKLAEDEIPPLEYQNNINSYQVSLYKRIMSKMGLEEYYDIDESYWNIFADFESGDIGIGKLIEEMEDSLSEDLELARLYGKHIKEVEKGNSKTHSIEKPEDLFKLL